MKSVASDGSQVEQVFEVLTQCIHEIHFGDQIFNRDGNFIQNLTGDSTDFSKAALYVLDRSALANTIAEDTLKKKPNLMEQFKEFGRPTGIAINQENQVIIADSKSRLQVYNKIVDY